VRTSLSIGIVGLGEWGRDVARTIAELPRAEIRWLCDRDPKVQLRSQERYPEARRTVDVDALLEDEALDAIVVATPSASRFDLARDALEADKHVLLREPVALSADQADELVARAERRQRRLSTGGGVLHHPAVRALGRLLEHGELGETYYLTLRRQQPCADGSCVLWDVGVDDVSLVLALLRDTPVEATAHGEAYVDAGTRDVVSCHLRFATGISAQLHLSRLGHRRVRELAAVGSRRTAVFDGGGDGELSVFEGAAESLHLLHHDPDLGAVVTPRFASIPALRLDCEAFLEAIRSEDVSLADARRAAATVNVLQALDASEAAEETVVEEPPAAVVLRLPTAPPEEPAASAEDGQLG
jgi:predicted dehydrogenase